MWYKTSKVKPPFDVELEVCDSQADLDAGEFYDGIAYMERRVCMMAGFAGGYGYFGKGFACSYESEADTGLVVDEPMFWRFKYEEDGEDFNEEPWDH